MLRYVTLCYVMLTPIANPKSPVSEYYEVKITKAERSIKLNRDPASFISRDRLVH